MLVAQLYRYMQCGFRFSEVRGADELRDSTTPSTSSEFLGHGAYEEDAAQRRNEANLRVEHVHGYVASG
jgi:hypothetical protein